jgi:uncharacterized protein YjdB/poly(3-hydroxybutyrate) depolymerase
MKKNILIKIVMVLYFSIVGTVFVSAQTFAYKSHTNVSIASYSMPYRLFIPDGYNATTSYPLVLFLHGAGERGTDNNAPLDGSQGAKLWAEIANQASYPCFVLAPQCPSDKQWVNTNWSLGSYSITNIPMSTELKMVKDIIETLETQYNIDASRLFITGLSMGGYGTWDFILRYPSMFKAAIPICGAGDPSKASLISTMPLRVFHSSDDPTVPVAGSRDMVNAINALGPNTRTEFYTEYTDQGHFSWLNAYNTPDLVNWLFTTNPIKVGLTDLTDQPGIITAQGENQPNLKGYAFDNATTTKWFDLATANPTTRASWIQYKLSGNSYVVTQYTITSADDFPDRDPKSWNLLGSNDGSVWTTLDIRTNELFSSRSQKNSYTFTNSAAYTYYRLQINSVNDPVTATGVQLAELEILGIPAVTSVTVSPTVLYLDINDLKQLYATVVPSNASNAVTWSSSNHTVATVSSTGLVTAKAPGIATITVTSANNNKSATCDVTVFDTSITKYEAENATLTWLNIQTNCANYSGTGFVVPFDNGSSVEFSITGATAGSQNINLRYANGGSSDGNIHLYVNGIMIKQAILPNTGGWCSWGNHIDNVTLKDGTNTIKYQKDAGDVGNFNVDYLALINIDNSTGIIEISNSEKESDISLFPNPLSTGSLSIKLPEDATQLSIFDVTGKLVYKEKVLKNEFLIDRSVFKSKGVYVLNVVTTKNNMNKKVIVIK